MAVKSCVVLVCRLELSAARHLTKHRNITSRFASTVGWSYFHNPGKEPLKNLTVGRLLDEAVDKWPERKALVSMHEDVSLSFGEIRRKADMLASGLVELGLRPGDRVAMMGPNSHSWYLVFMAACKAGLILVNINPAFQAEEIRYCLQRTGVKALVTEEEYRGRKYHGTICSLVPGLDSLPPRTALRSHDLPHFTTLIVNTDHHLPGSWRLCDVSAAVTEAFRETEASVQPDDACNIQFSSGTTGLPKPALLSHFSIINNSYLYGKAHGYSNKHHSICLQVPLFHTFGMCLGILAAINHGCTLVLPSAGFSPLHTIQALKKLRCTIIYGTPTMYIDLCNKIKDLQDEELDKNLKLEFIASGGAVCTPSLFKLMSETLRCAYVGSAYGMTETSPILMTNKADETLDLRMTTVGRVAEHTECKVVDDDGKMVPFGTAGEAWFRGYATMLQYYQDCKATDDAVSRCGWIKTGDLMVLHENGYGRVIGRKKDIIIRGGENIFPTEIEEFLEKHPSVLESQVFGVTDERLGEQVCASVKLKPGRPCTAQEIRDYCKGKISHFKIPKYINIVEQFPKTTSGKVQKYILKKEMEEKLREPEAKPQ